MSQGTDIRLLVLTLGGGPALVAWGLRTLARNRLMENTATSKVRGAAMGLVELKGAALPYKKEIPSPVLRRPCCWWKTELQEYRRSGKSGSWVTIRTEFSPLPVYLKDETGQILVDPAAADLVTAKSVHPKGPGLRLIERVIYPLDPLYVLGELTHRKNHMAEKSHNLSLRLQAAKSNPAVMAQADANKDGMVDAEEWDALKLKIEEEFLKEEALREMREPPEDNLIVRAPEDKPFIVSTRPEEELLGWGRFGVFLKIAGGVATAALGGWLALQEGWPLPWTVACVGTGMILGLLAGTLKLKTRGSYLWL